MREMGTVDLLTREGEIAIAKRLEEGISDTLHALAGFPGAVELILNSYDQSQTEEGKLADLLVGFLDPVEFVVPAAQVVPGQAKDDDDDGDVEEESKGPDPVLAAERFEALRKQLKKTERVLRQRRSRQRINCQRIESAGRDDSNFSNWCRNILVPP